MLTIGLEILEDAPDVVAVIAAIGGGRFDYGTGERGESASKPKVKVWERNRKRRAGRIVIREQSPQALPDGSIVCLMGGGKIFFTDWERMRPGGWFNCR